MKCVPVLLLAVFASPLFVGCLGAGERGDPLTRGDVAAPEEPVKTWASLEEAIVRPGALIHTPTGTCPSNFLFIRPDNTSVFLGTTAHCVRDVPVGGLVTVGGHEVLGFVAYSSYETMAQRNESDPFMLEYNDFAVVKIDESYRKFVNPTMLHYGGPAGMADAAAVGMGALVKTYGNETGQTGVVTGRAGDWAFLVHNAPPTIPGGMGRGALTPDGKALGVVVNLGVMPNPGANGIARLDTLMTYARDNAKLYMDLVTADLVAPPTLAGLPVTGSTGTPSDALPAGHASRAYPQP